MSINLLLNLQLGLVLWSGVGEQSPTPQPRYYDTRERVAATMTFTWAETCHIRIPLERIRAHNAEMMAYIHALAQSTKTPIESFNDMLSKLIIDENIASMIFELSNYYTIERTPQRTRIRTRRQAIDLHRAKVSEPLWEVESYLQGNLVISVHRDLSNGQVTAVYLAQCEEELVGWGSPFGDAQPEWMVLHAGISPFRLYGHKPEDWRLVTVSPEEWVFELPRKPEQEPNEQEDESAQNNQVRPLRLYAPSVRFHLDRRYQDALSRLEIRYADGTTYIWRTLRYKRIENVWFPAEVEMSAKHPSQEAVSKMVLVTAQRTKAPLKLEIPEKTPVYDFRHLGQQMWVHWGEYKPTEWDESLLKPPNRSK